jgi:two-component system, response regulator / RNA-binding antiterminator
MRVLVVDESTERAELLRAALLLAGHEVTAARSSPLALLQTIEQVQPDVIVISIDSPSRDVLEHLVMVSQHTPRPVVMFTSDGSEPAIRAATRAGVSAYVVDGLVEHRIKTIVDVAVARFEEMQDLRDQLAEATTQLAERKVIERAKGLLMKSRNLDEQAAFATLRKAAMDRKLKLSEVAQRIVDAADLLGA